MLRKGTWAAHLKEMEVKRVKMAKEGNEAYNQKLYNYDDVEYIGIITVGSPDQSFRVVLDTGSSIFWIPDYTCAASTPEVCDESACDPGVACQVFCPEKVCCKKEEIVRTRNPCRGKNFFASTNSSTYIPMSGRWRMFYAQGSAEGFYGNDTVRFGEVGTKQLEVHGSQFGQAEKISDDFTDSRFLLHEFKLLQEPLDGVLGMAFAAQMFRGPLPIFERAWKLGLVDPIFTFYMKRGDGYSEFFKHSLGTIDSYSYTKYAWALS
ncbi:unnamed protein product [Strongylus vulgaris]|uniref:Peptidase A1 domain-containing protein n=1 Tax=Strongylus vulgaris TaxID=40348 RepID=A0A3P7ITX7_STRVU|nr:unnamed protein product [Strongylus vulgaris]